MAPRSRARASRATASSPPAPKIADLPQDVLVRILGLLPGLGDRQRAALVSKRFAAAASSPQLLHEVELPVWSGLDTLHSQAAWLARHGHHARKLSFCGEADDEDEAAAVASAVSSCLSMIGSGGQLTDLAVWVSPICHSGWLLAMRSLRRLSLVCGGGHIHVSPSIAQLTALQSLSLDGTVDLGATTRLPTSLTRVVLKSDGTEEMPPQLAQLPQLQRLLLDECSYSADSLSRLAALGGSLTRLDLADMVGPTTGESLAALSRLEHLQYAIDLGIEEAGEAVGLALPHLTRLTYLELWGSYGWDVIMPAMSGLPQLQLCHVANYPLNGGEAEAVPLRSGPWLCELRWLCADVNTLLRSTAVLQAATALESISIGHSPSAVVDWLSPAATAFFDWLASHPPLRRLGVDLKYPAKLIESSAFVVRLMQLWRRRPALLVQTPGFGDTGDSFGKFVAATYLF